jgi:hypothetical protein
VVAPLRTVSKAPAWLAAAGVDILPADLSSSAGAAAALAAIDAKYGAAAISSVVSSFGGMVAYGVDFSAVGDAGLKQAIEASARAGEAVGEGG